MGKILDALRAFFKEDNWPFTEIAGETETILRTGFAGDNGIVTH